MVLRKEREEGGDRTRERNRKGLEKMAERR